MPGVERVLVAGGSAGAIGPLQQLVSGLPAGRGVAALVTVHHPASGSSELPSVLARSSRFRAVQPADGDPLHADQIYVAPPGCHLELEIDRVRVRSAPRVNGRRGSVDVLFKSAASSYGAAVVAVVLSGLLDDGACGLLSVCRAGGAALVQQLAQAEFPDMPRAALQQAPYAREIPDEDLGRVACMELLSRSIVNEEDPSPCLN